MAKRPLLVFAGQSNMMGAAVYPASEQIYFENSFEYLHKPKRMGEPSGIFKNFGFPSGEFSYIDMKAAYGNMNMFQYKSSLTNYAENTYFCPSMGNLDDKEAKTTKLFKSYSEKTATAGTCLAPFVVKALEENGYPCCYAHIAKGSVSIKHYLEGGAAEYFDQKVTDFFKDSAKKFPDDDLSEKVLMWLQGEGDGKAENCYDDYRANLSLLWTKAKRMGFNKLLIYRIGFWGNDIIKEVMRAQEDFCKQTENAYIVTRALSYFKYPNQNEDGWFKTPPTEEYCYCRDSFYGFGNNHVNEKGFKVIASHAVPNILSVLNGEDPVLEEENIIPLL